MSANNR